MTGVTKTSTPPGVALAAQVSADNWHRRLGHMNPANMELLREMDGNGIEYTGTASGCDICAVGKSTQKPHPKKTKHKTNGPMQLVYTDRMGGPSRQQPEEDTSTSSRLLTIIPG